MIFLNWSAEASPSIACHTDADSFLVQLDVPCRLEIPGTPGGGTHSFFFAPTPGVREVAIFPDVNL